MISRRQDVEIMSIFVDPDSLPLFANDEQKWESVEMKTMEIVAVVAEVGRQGTTGTSSVMKVCPAMAE